MKRIAVVSLTLALTLAGCSTGVKDEKGWNKVLTRGYPCSELIDVAEDLPSSVDPQKVAHDLRNAGCEVPAAFAARG
ncbi:MAG: hypothetical protein M3314_05710 [Actinomycetota bacterium]|nr:hypothetical protein [Actinomycetota bacterium]